MNWCRENWKSKRQLMGEPRKHARYTVNRWTTDGRRQTENRAVFTRSHFSYSTSHIFHNSWKLRKESIHCPTVVIVCTSPWEPVQTHSRFSHPWTRAWLESCILTLFNNILSAFFTLLQSLHLWTMALKHDSAVKQGFSSLLEELKKRDRFGGFHNKGVHS